MEFTPEPIEPALLVEEVRGVLRGVAAQKKHPDRAEVAPELGSSCLIPASYGRCCTTTFQMR